MAMSASGQVLALNAGSSSLKFELFAPGDAWASRARGVVEAIGEPRSALLLAGADRAPLAVADHRAAAELVLDRLGIGSGAILAAVGHRVVHGGPRLTVPLRIGNAEMAELEALSALAPLHNPPALAVLEVARRRFADVPMIAVFDTAFFRELPETARCYALPERWRAAGMHRYGFHGIAHRYLMERTGELRGEAPRALTRLVTFQLGHGCSVAAIERGRPVDTSMGYTPLEGLVMATRPGDLDPGAVLEMAREGLAWTAIDHALNHESGLLGLSGASGDVRELLRLERQGHAGARLALEVFCRRARKYLGAYAAVLGGLDAIVFGGGIGEHAPEIRARICEGCEWLGLELEPRANDAAIGTEARISAPGSRVEAWVIPVEEERAIAHAALECAEPRSRNQSSEARSDHLEHGR